MRAVFPLLVFAVVALVAYMPADHLSASTDFAADTTWTWPDRAENLQVLPADTGPFELSQIMRGFTQALGVRCQHCHVGTEEMSLVEFDFVSDEKDHKEVARQMMRMTWAINNDMLANMDGLHEAEGMRVTCYTCHRGGVTPQTRAPNPEWRPPPSDDEAEDDHGDHDHEHEDGEDHDHGDDG